MKRVIHFLLAAVCSAVLLVPPTASAQFFPPPQFDYGRYPPIQHRVPFYRQSTMVWCWVAAAKMVAEFYGRERVASQCAMLEQQYHAPCCANPQSCMRPGHIAEIQALIQRFGGRVSSLAPPADGFALYNALRRGPIVMHTRQGGGHFVVATGMRVVPSAIGPLGIVSVNDPFFGQREYDFPTLLQLWTAALLVY